MKDGWKRLPFEEVVSDESGGNAKTPQSEFLQSGQLPIIDQGKSLISGYTNDSTRTCKAQLPVIIFGDHTRCLKFIDFPFAMGADGVKVLRPRFYVDEKYLFRYLQSLHLPNAGYDRHFKYLKRTEIVLPPIAEQKRIAAILDKAESLRSLRRQTLAQLDTLTQSIFLEMFGNPATNPKGWDVCKVSDYVSTFQGGKNIDPEDEKTVTRNRVVKVSSVTSMVFRSEQSKPLPDFYKPPEDHFIKSGDLLFSRANTTELVGAVAYVQSTPENLTLADKVWRFVWKEPLKVDPIFIWILFQTPAVRHEISSRATGTSGSMKNISQPKTLSIPTILPPLPLQQEFARRVEAVEQLKATHRESLAHLDALFASLQHRAFRGEL